MIRWRSESEWEPLQSCQWLWALGTGPEHTFVLICFRPGAMEFYS